MVTFDFQAFRATEFLSLMLVPKIYTTFGLQGLRDLLPEVLSELKMKPKNLSEERLGLRTFSGIRHEFFENHWHGPLAGQVAAEGHIWQMFLPGEEGGGHPRLLRQELVH